jgi:hypothetical protein
MSCTDYFDASSAAFTTSSLRSKKLIRRVAEFGATPNRAFDQPLQQGPTVMTDFRNEIDLRWVLRNVRAKRFAFISCTPEEMRRIVEMGLVEMVGDRPRLTAAGFAKLEAPVIRDPTLEA